MKCVRMCLSHTLKNSRGFVRLPLLAIQFVHPLSSQTHTTPRVAVAHDFVQNLECLPRNSTECNTQKMVWRRWETSVKHVDAKPVLRVRTRPGFSNMYASDLQSERSVALCSQNDVCVPLRICFSPTFGHRYGSVLRVHSARHKNRHSFNIETFSACRTTSVFVEDTLYISNIRHNVHDHTFYVCGCRSIHSDDATGPV